MDSRIPAAASGNVTPEPATPSPPNHRIAIATAMQLTPPTSPETSARKSRSNTLTHHVLTPPDTPTSIRAMPERSSLELPESVVLSELPQICKAFSVASEGFELGETIAAGQWSIVRAAARASDNSVLALKVSKGKLAAKVIRREAQVLTYLSMQPGYEDFVIPFIGYDEHLHALALDYAPLTLESHVHALCGAEGSTAAIDLTDMETMLVSGLDFLHRHDIIHGDIKPSNILLVENASKPLFCDFSAARLDHPECLPNESAGTYDYMAPELFSFKNRSDWPTKASDVFALGVTILFAITGQSPYQSSTSFHAKIALARNGDPLNSVLASSTNARRYMEVRSPALELTFAKNPRDRLSAGQWLARLP